MNTICVDIFAYSNITRILSNHNGTQPIRVRTSASTISLHTLDICINQSKQKNIHDAKPKKYTAQHEYSYTYCIKLSISFRDVKKRFITVCTQINQYKKTALLPFLMWASRAQNVLDSRPISLLTTAALAIWDDAEQWMQSSDASTLYAFREGEIASALYRWKCTINLLGCPFYSGENVA